MFSKCFDDNEIVNNAQQYECDEWLKSGPESRVFLVLSSRLAF